MEKTVVELFAGVGGFRVGLNEVKSIDLHGRAVEAPNFKFVFANQWEPSTRCQDAYDCYVTRFGAENVSNIDVSLIDKEEIPSHALLTGGFPCQDYSVARSLKNEKGINGKKGVLWWQIYEILDKKRPPFVLLENVDRIIKAPAFQRGRDFGIILSCFYQLNYSVEWRVINAADYGMPQKRKRIFIFAYSNETKFGKNQSKHLPVDVINSIGLFAKTFPIYDVQRNSIRDIPVPKVTHTSLSEVSENFSFKFGTSGWLCDDTIFTTDIIALPHPNGITLGDILQKEEMDQKLFIGEKFAKFQLMKGSKRILRTSKKGFQYHYCEGQMTFPDALNRPARTMLTSEGTLNRSTHIIVDNMTGLHRLISPIEAERINMFPDNWTNTKMSNRKRYFMMGNALVTGIISKIGNELSLIIDNE